MVDLRAQIRRIVDTCWLRALMCSHAIRLMCPCAAWVKGRKQNSGNKMRLGDSIKIGLSCKNGADKLPAIGRKRHARSEICLCRPFIYTQSKVTFLEQSWWH